MKKILEKIKHHYRNLSMQKKMVYSYTLPVLVICAVTFFLGYSVFYNSYRKQLRHSIDQSCVQANSFINNYIDNMNFISLLITENRDINEILSSPYYGKYMEMGEVYREYYAISEAIREIEKSNFTYRIAIYIPDDIPYSNNNYHFYQESSLMEKAYYQELMDSVKEGKPYFALIDETRFTAPTRKDTYLALFKKITVQQGGQEKTYIVKVETLLKNFQNVLDNALNTENSLIYILDENQHLLMTSDDEMYGKLNDREQLPHSWIANWSTCNVGNRELYGLHQKLSKYNWRIFALIPKDEFRSRSNFILTLMCVMIVVLSVAVGMISYLIARYYTNRLSRLQQRMGSVENGDLNTQLSIPPGKSGDELDAIYTKFNYMTEELQRLMKEHYRLGKSVMSAELKALQAQINPHFLYNTLDLINWGAVDHGAEEVALMARNLGQFYRLSLNHGRTAILIGEELKHVETYVNIENVHFAGAINMDIQVPQSIRAYACLNIILQPFVENAIVHGIAEYPDIIECNITLSARMEGEDILFSIADDGPGMSREQIETLLTSDSVNKQQGYGVKNVNFRMQLCYGEKYGVSYETESEEGTKVYLRIPAYTYEELEEKLNNS
ncbi:MAG: histidine kinase [Lachnospiraceae bacterium]|nr:histidine kinase [Lachnospiraceae bacterium]